MMQTDQTPAQRSKRKPNRQHSIEFKRSVVEQTLQQGVRISHIAREHNICLSLVHDWRKRYRESVSSTLVKQKLLPVALIKSIVPAQSNKAPVPEDTSASSGFILINAGQISVRVEGRADPVMLKLILTQLLPC
jgi:transposase